MGGYNSKNRKRKINKNKVNRKRMKLLGMIAAIGLGATVVGGEYAEHKQEDRIIENASIEINRDFRNIRQEEMGKYLKNEIENLYEKYPDLNNMVLEENGTGTSEFIKDIYRLYKAFMVDKTEKDVNMDDITVRAEYAIILQSDEIMEGERKIAETYKEQYKTITNSFVHAKKVLTDESGAELSKKMYELLALEFGLKDNVLATEDVKEAIEKNGIYYDKDNNTVYTKEGIGQIVLNKEKAKEEPEKSETLLTDNGYEIID